MPPAQKIHHETQGMARLLGSACSRRVLSANEAEILEWALVQMALDRAGPVRETSSSFQKSLLAGSDWHSALAAALLQTPRTWGADIQAAMSSFEEVREEYRSSDVAVYQFADRIVTRNAAQKPPFAGYVPMSAPEDVRTDRLLEMAHQSDLGGETLELAKVIMDRFPHILKNRYKLSFDGAVAALFCDLEIEAEKVPRLLAVSALISLVFSPGRER